MGRKRDRVAEERGERRKRLVILYCAWFFRKYLGKVLSVALSPQKWAESGRELLCIVLHHFPSTTFLTYQTTVKIGRIL